MKKKTDNIEVLFMVLKVLMAWSVAILASLGYFTLLAISKNQMEPMQILVSLCIISPAIGWLLMDMALRNSNQRS